jgi:hypothetical protein
VAVSTRILDPPHQSSPRSAGMPGRVSKIV